MANEATQIDLPHKNVQLVDSFTSSQTTSLNSLAREGTRYVRIISPAAGPVMAASPVPGISGGRRQRPVTRVLDFLKMSDYHPAANEGGRSC